LLSQGILQQNVKKQDMVLKTHYLRSHTVEHSETSQDEDLSISLASFL